MLYCDTIFQDLFKKKKILTLMMCFNIIHVFTVPSHVY